MEQQRRQTMTGMRWKMPPLGMALCALLLLMATMGHAQTFTPIGSANGSNSGNSVSTSTATSVEVYPTPFMHYYENGRAQYVYRAAEISAAGVPAGSVINNIRWNVTDANGASGIPNYTVKAGTTGSTQTGTNNGFITSPATQWGPATYTPTTGANTFALATPFVWNGSTNIVIEICHAGSGFTSNAIVSWQSGLSYRGCSQTRADGNTTVCATTTGAGNQNRHPWLTLGWSPPCTGTAPNVSASNSGPTCAGFPLTLTGTITSGSANNYEWTGPNGFTSTAQNPTIPSPALNAAGTYQFRARLNTDCWSTWASTTVTMNGTPAATTLSQSSFSVCVGETPFGDGLLSTGCATPATLTRNTVFPGSNHAIEGTAEYTTVSVDVPALPGGAVITSATLILSNVVANSPSWQSEINVGTSGMYSLAPAPISADESPGTIASVSIPMPGFPATSGTLNLRVFDSFNDGSVNPDATIGTALVEVQYEFPGTFKWYDAAVGGSVVSTSLALDPVADLGVSTATPGVYTYYAVCESSLGCGVRVPGTFTVNPRPTGTASGGGTVCVSDALPNVTFNFTGTPPYDFEYSGPSGNIPVLGHNSNSFTITNAAAGTYSLNTLNDQLCSATSLGGNVSVNVVQLPNAGTDNTLVTTSTSLPTNMLSLLGPNAQVGGSWSGPSPVVGDLYDPATMDEGVYTYTKNADAPCSGSDEATIEVSEVPITALVLEFVMPSFGMLPTWELREVGTDALAASGGGNFVPFAGIHVNNTGVPPGNFYLTFPGSVAPATKYTLRTAGNPGIRLIENVAAAGTAHQVAEFAVTPPAPSTEGTVQIPVGPTELLFTSCDKYFWKKGEFIVVNEDPDVAAVWIPGAGTNQSSTTGYDFWFYDPNGSYSFMRQRRHNETDGFGNVGSARTCHMQVNHWAAANWIPNQLPLNVRVRAVVENVPKNWGPACRFVRDDVLATCTPTWLMDVPGNPFISCNVIRAFNNQSINRVYARPVSGATKYKFIFTTSEGTIEREVSTYYLTLGWNASVAPPLEDEVVYDVTVQAFKGGSYCTLGQSCTVQICNTPGSCTNDFSGGQQHSAIDAPDAEAALTLYPNPNRGDQLTVALTSVSEGVNTVNVDLYDLSGKRMIARTIAAQDGFVNTVLDLNNELAAGMYMVQITAGDQVYTQRLVIQP